MNYVVSDIHGRLDRFEKLIDIIGLSEQDNLYILGDVVDRGPNPIKALRYIMKHKNIHCIMGNHDRMMLKALRYDDERELRRWNKNGCESTLEEFNQLSEKKREEVLDYIEEMEYFKIVKEKFLLVHAGFDPERLREDMKTKTLHQSLLNQEERLVWEREKFFCEKALEGYTVIFGHTPRPSLDERLGIQSEIPYKIWFDEKFKDKIGIDTGNCYDGRMACLRLEDMREYYVD